MSKKAFTDKEKELLRQNKYVERVGDRGITYTLEFKMHFLDEYAAGKSPTVIFKEAGFDIDLIGHKRINSATQRFKKNDKRDEGLTDRRRFNTGRPTTKNLPQEELIKRLEEKIIYLQQENEFLKKIERAEREVKKRNR